jgi:TPR repeat protein
LKQETKYYHKAAEFGDPLVQNSFRVCLERGMAMRSNHALALHYWQRSATQRDPDEGNNLGLCLWHGRRARQNIKTVSEWSRFVTDHGPPSSEVNYERSVRLLGHWAVTDRYSRTLCQRCSWKPLMNAVKADEAGTALVATIEQLKSTTAGFVERPSGGVTTCTSNP